VNSIDHYVVKHRIDREGRLLEGAPLTRKVLRKICSLVIPSLQTLEYLPERVLAYSPGSAMLWWAPGAPRRIFFTKETGLRSGIYPLPATLFLVMNQTLHAWAVTASVRPEPSTIVYHSPFFNVYENGSCCMGDINIPRNASPRDVNVWEEVFFGGACTSHILPKLKGIDPYDLWKAAKGKTVFPHEYLVPCGTVGDVITSISKRQP
jgi:PRTRC genetic system protein B